MVEPAQGGVTKIKAAVSTTHRWLFAFTFIAVFIAGSWMMTIAAGNLAGLVFSQAGPLELTRTVASTIAPAPFLIPTWRLGQLAFASKQCSDRRFGDDTLARVLSAHHAFWREMSVATVLAVTLYGWSTLRLFAG